jgi:hypothetical protein
VTSQDRERESASERHQRTVEREGNQVRTLKAIERTIKGHALTNEHKGREGTGQNHNRKTMGKWRSLSIERKGKHKLGQRNKASGRVSLTNCRAQRQG